MRFAEPVWFYGFLALAALAAFCFWALYKKRQALEQFACKELLPTLTFSCDMQRQHLKTLLLLLACLLCIISLLRPQWGSHWQEIKKQGIDVILAIDVSRSMLSTDVKPSRLERVKFSVKDFVRALQGDRVGLIAFAGNAFLQCPLTNDYNGLLLTLGTLDVQTVSRGGTNIALAIQEARRAYQGALSPNKILILVSDGEEQEGDAETASKDAQKEGIVIHCIGIGSPEGELIPVVNENKERSFLKDREDRVVKTRLNETLLKKIAQITGGAYVRSTRTNFGLEDIYKHKLALIEKKETETKMIRLYEDRYQIFLMLAFIILILELFIPERRKAS